jgi:radical SAM superfamily enzyme YgiQ (UPF0313 family)
MEKARTEFTGAILCMKRPEVLLVNPWIHDFAAYDLWARPLGLLILASRLRDAGWEPRLLDCLDPDHPDMEPVAVKEYAQGRFHRTVISKPDSLKQFPRNYCRYGVNRDIIGKDLQSIPRPAAILVTSFMTYWYSGVQETIEALREAFPSVPVLLGGIYASLMPDHALVHCRPDAVIAGPGESVVFQSLFVHTGIDLGRDTQAPDVDFVPALDLMRRIRFLPLITTRGCPYRCAYCASQKIAPFFVRRSPDRLARDIETAVDRYGIRDIALYDDAFLVDSSTHALPLLAAISERVPGTRWHAPNGLHAAAITSEVAVAMKSAGFQTVRIGYETASDGFHARTGGKTTLNGFVSAVQNLRSAGFSREQIGAYVLVGRPLQTTDRIEQDVDTVLEAGAMPKLAEYSPIPGTGMWQDALAAARFPIDREPLFHNCTLLPCAAPGVDSRFLGSVRRRIRNQMNGFVSPDVDRGHAYC